MLTGGESSDRLLLFVPRRFMRDLLKSVRPAGAPLQTASRHNAHLVMKG